MFRTANIYTPVKVTYVNKWIFFKFGQPKQVPETECRKQAQHLQPNYQ